MTHARGPAQSRPNIVVLYARDDRITEGGADLRVAALTAALVDVADVETIEVGGTPTLVGRARAALRGVPPRLAQGLGGATSLGLADRLERADVIVAATTFSLPHIPSRLLGRTILDAHNVEARVVAQLASSDPSALRRIAYRRTQAWTSRWEAARSRRVAQVWAVSREESDWFRAAGAHDVVLVPNGVDVDVAQAAPHDNTVLFVASFRSLFNRQALEWFLAEVWPQVLESLPDAGMRVVGRGSEEFSGPRVEALGYVPDVEEVYASARLAVVPLQSGAGTRLKVLEAMARGVPVIATSIGCEGLGLVAGRDLIVADDASRFARAVVEVLTDPALSRTLAARGAQIARETFAWAEIGKTAARAALAVASATKS